VLEIRAATDSDREQLLTLSVQLHEFTAAGVPSRLKVADVYDTQGMKASVGRVIADPAATFLVAVDGDIVGFAEVRIQLAEDDPGVVPVRRAHLQSLLVTERRRGEGIGTRLLEAAEQWAREMGAHEIELDHWVFDGDPGSFYERAGYRVVSRMLTRSPG
jgi:GNAT superfamily N-acetyltransferase